MNAYFYSHYTPPSHSPPVSAAASDAALRPHARANGQSSQPYAVSPPLHHRPFAAAAKQQRVVMTNTHQQDISAPLNEVSTPPLRNLATPPPLPPAAARSTATQSNKNLTDRHVNTAELPPPPQQSASAVPCLVLFSPQGPRPLDGLTSTSTLSLKTSIDDFVRGGRGPLRARTSSANRLTKRDANAGGENERLLGRRAVQPLEGVRCVYDRDTRSQLLHIAPGTEADFSSFMRLPGSTRGWPTAAAAAGVGAGHTVLAVQFCVAAPVWTAAERQRAGASATQPEPSVTPPPGSVQVELVVRTSATTSSCHHNNQINTCNSGVGIRGGYRLRFTNAVHETQRHAHHTRFPLQCVRTAQWVQLYIDVDQVMQTCASQGVGVTGATHASKSTLTVVRSLQLRIGAGAVTGSSSSSSGGLYVRRIVAGHGLPLPHPRGVEYVVHPAGQYSVTGEDIMRTIKIMPTADAAGHEELARQTVLSTWTMPEPLRLPAEAGETLSLFVRTGDEQTLREPFVSAPPQHLPVATLSTENNALISTPSTRGSSDEAAIYASQHQQQHLGVGRAFLKTNAPSIQVASRATTPVSSALTPHDPNAQEDKTPQRLHTPPSVRAEVRRKVEEATPQLHHRAAKPVSAGQLRQKRQQRHHPTALELLRLRQQQQQPVTQKLEDQPRSSWSTAPPLKIFADNYNAPESKSKPYSASSAAAAPSRPSPSPFSRQPSVAEAFVAHETAPSATPYADGTRRLIERVREPAEGLHQQFIGHRIKAVSNEARGNNTVVPGDEGHQEGNARALGLPAQHRAESIAAPSVPVVLPPSEESFEVSEPSQVEVTKWPVKANLSNNASRLQPSASAGTRVPVEPALPLHSDSPDDEDADDHRHRYQSDAALVADATLSMDTSSLASVLDSTVSSSTPSSLSCTSAVVELMREMSARVSQLNAALSEKSSNAAPAAVDDTRRLLSTRSAVGNKEAALLPESALHTPPVADEQLRDRNEASSAAAAGAAVVARSPPPSPQEGVRRALLPESTEPTKAVGAVTPLSLLSAVMGGEYRDVTAPCEMKCEVETQQEHKRGWVDGCGATVNDAKAILEVWSSTEMPLQLPGFAPQPSHPLPEQTGRGTAAMEAEASARKRDYDENSHARVPYVQPAKGVLLHDTTAVRVGGEEEKWESHSKVDAFVSSGLPPPGSTATSWTFHSASVNADTTVTTSGSAAAISAAASPAAAAAALPRETTQNERVPTAHQRVLSATPAFSNGDRRVDGAVRPATKAVVWRRIGTGTIAAIGQHRTEAEKNASQITPRNDVRLDVNTSLVLHPEQFKAGGETTVDMNVLQGRKEELEVKKWPAQKPQRHEDKCQGTPAFPLPRPTSEFAADVAGIRTPLNAASSVSPHASYSDVVQSARLPTPSNTIVKNPLHTASSTSAYSNNNYSAAPPSHHSYSTVSSFHMWLPNPLPVLSAARVRYPSVTTPSSGDSGGRSQPSLTHAEDAHGPALVASAGKASYCAAPPVVRLSAAGNVPFAPVTASAPAAKGGVLDTSAITGVEAPPNAATSPPTDCEGSLSRLQSAETQLRLISNRSHAGPARDAAGTGTTDAQRTCAVPEEVTRYIYDSVLHCYLDTETNAYVAKIP